MGLSAQLPPLGENYWSVRGGLSLSRGVSGNYVTAYHTGYAVGACYAVAISELTPFYFESGALFVRRGGVDSGYIGGYGERYDIRSYNIELPFSILFRLNFSSKIALSLDFGGYLSVALTGEVDGGESHFNPYLASNITLRELCESQGGAIFHRFDAGPRGGFSLYITNFLVNFSAAMGVINLFNAEFRQRGYELQSKSLNFSMGYLF